LVTASGAADMALLMISSSLAAKAADEPAAAMRNETAKTGHEYLLMNVSYES
jgi:hypothetical protein